MATIQDRNRQEVQHAQADADDCQKHDKSIESYLGGMAGILGDGDWSTDIFRGNLKLEHLEEHFYSQYAHSPGTHCPLTQSAERPIAHAHFQLCWYLRIAWADFDLTYDLAISYNFV